MAARLESQAHTFIGACFGQQRCRKNEGDKSELESERGGDEKTKMRKERVEREKETIREREDRGERERERERND